MYSFESPVGIIRIFKCNSGIKSEINDAKRDRLKKCRIIFIERAIDENGFVKVRG